MLRKENSSALLVGMQTGTATVKNSIEVPQKIKIGMALWPGDSTFEYILVDIQNTNSKE